MANRPPSVVTRYSPNEVLQPGNWTVGGRPGIWTWLTSGKIEPGAEHMPLSSGRMYEVMPGNLTRPSGWQLIKGGWPLHQYLYQGPILTPAPPGTLPAPVVLPTPPPWDPHWNEMYNQEYP